LPREFCNVWHHSAGGVGTGRLLHRHAMAVTEAFGRIWTQAGFFVPVLLAYGFKEAGFSEAGAVCAARLTSSTLAAEGALATGSRIWDSSLKPAGNFWA
jgi:hypothetical protein